MMLTTRALQPDDPIMHARRNNASQPMLHT